MRGSVSDGCNYWFNLCIFHAMFSYSDFGFGYKWESIRCRQACKQFYGCFLEKSFT